MSKKELPTLRGEALYIPFVGAIIQRVAGQGQKQILVQIRQKETDKDYNGSIEIPGGKLKAYEDIFNTVRREVKEECGLDVTFIDGEEKKSEFLNKGDASALIEPFCVTQMQNGPFIGLIFLCHATGEPLQETDETKEARWIDAEELARIVDATPERIYTAFLAPLKKYLDSL